MNYYKIEIIGQYRTFENMACPTLKPILLKGNTHNRTQDMSYYIRYP